MLETWDSDNLTYGISSETHLEEYEYKLEETDIYEGTKLDWDVTERMLDIIRNNGYKII